MIRLGVALGLCVWALAALAQPHAPFVASDGLLRPDLRYSTVQAVLGPPPLSEVEREVTQAGRVRGGDWWVAYPAQGLVFGVTREERSAADPRIVTLRVRPPWVPRPGERIHAGLGRARDRPALDADRSPAPGAAGPSGRATSPILALGQDAAAVHAQAVAQGNTPSNAHYRVRPPAPDSPATALTLTAADDTADPPARTLTVHLKDDRVVALDYRRTDGLRFPGGAAGVRAVRWSAAVGVLLLALTIHLKLPRWRPAWVARARAIDEARPVVRGAALWPLRLLGGALLLLGGWLWLSQVGWQPGSSSAVVSLEGPLLQAAGAVLGVLGLVLCVVPRLQYQPMQRLVGTLWGSALMAAAALAGALPQWPLP